MFYYPYTCPVIDDNINDAKESVKYIIESLLHDSREEGFEDSSIDYYFSDIWSNIEHYFENVRSSNADIRGAAEKQVDECETKIAELESDCEYYQAQIAELEAQLNVYQ